MNTQTSNHSDILAETTRHFKGINRFFEQIDWNQMIATFINKGILILIVVILILLFRKILLKVLDKTFDAYKKKDDFSENRLQTLHTISKNFIQYSLFFIGMYSILTIIGIPVGSLLAGAGIVGIAIGLGAQGFINDVITGFFLIYERQIDVGDHVMIDKIEGNVDDIGLRTTRIKSFNGTVHYIPNRQILIVSNLSRGNQLVLVDIRIDPKKQDIDQVISIMKKVNQETLNFLEDIRSEPTISGLIDVGGGNFAIRASVYTVSGSQAKIKSIMTTSYIEALTQAGIDLPSTPLNLTV